jgi:cytoskeleton protein RodZ
MAEIGSTLRETRMRARIDISEVETGTKIRAKYLRALENEEWDLLPGPVYVKSFLKTYGDYLGLDSRLLVEEFKRRYERPMEHEVRAMASTARERDKHRNPSRATLWLLSPRGVIGLAVVVILVALYVIGTVIGGGNSPTPPTNTIADGGHHHKKSHKHTSTDTSTDTTGSITTPPPPSKATLALVPTGTVWVCVENKAGKALVPGVIYNAGQTIPSQSSSELLVSLGNSHVTATVDGKAYAVTGSSAIGLKITPKGASPLSSPPTCNQ